jgi:hypothetical protein
LLREAGTVSTVVILYVCTRQQPAFSYHMLVSLFTGNNNTQRAVNFNLKNSPPRVLARIFWIKIHFGKRNTGNSNLNI